MPPMKYTDEQRAEALVLYVEHGTAEASRRTDIPRRTIRHWANHEGLAAARDLVLTEGGERLAKTYKVMRAEARVLMVEKITDLLERMDQPHVEFKVAGNEIHEVTHQIASSGDVKNYASAMKLILDSFRLEMGETTDRTDIDVTINGVDIAQLR